MVSITEPSATARLIERMVNFDGLSFDGYPSMFCLDEGLILDATEEARVDGSTWSCPVSYMAYLASECATSVQQVKNALAYINEYVSASISCNFHESGNPHYEAATGEGA